MTKKIIITGGLGYIGTELCKIYSGYSCNDKITVVDKQTGGTVYLINKVQAQDKDNRTYNRSELLKV